MQTFYRRAGRRALRLHVSYRTIQEEEWSSSSEEEERYYSGDEFTYPEEEFEEECEEECELEVEEGGEASAPSVKTISSSEDEGEEDEEDNDEKAKGKEEGGSYASYLCYGIRPPPIQGKPRIRGKNKTLLFYYFLTKKK